VLNLITISKLYIILQILLITSFTALGDLFLKRASQQPHDIFNKYLFFGLLIYSSTAFLWAYIYKYMKFSTSVTIYSIFSIFIFAIVGVAVFKESLSAVEILGMFFAIVSLIILARFG